MAKKKQPAPETVEAEISAVESELAALFERHLGPVRQPRQPGEFTAAELCKRYGYSEGRGNHVLNELIDGGRVARRKGPGNSFYYRFVE